MDAVILAGGKAIDAKARLVVAGRSLLQRVLDACAQSTCVGRVVVVGVDDHTDFSGPEGTVFLPDAGSLVDNILAGAEGLRPRNDPEGYFLAIACDLPLLTGAMLDWLCGLVGDRSMDFLYTVVRKETMDARFPGSGRTFYRLKDGEFCGGDVQVLSFRLMDRLDPLLYRAVEQRKSVLRMALLLGPAFLVRFAAGRATHEEICDRVARRLKIRGRVMISPYAEIGMDIDRASHLRAALAAGFDPDAPR